MSKTLILIIALITLIIITNLIIYSIYGRPLHLVTDIAMVLIFGSILSRHIDK